MARVTIEDCLKKIENRFAFSVAAIKRAKQLVDGKQALATEKDHKHVVTAFREIAEGKINIIDPEKTSRD